VKIIKLISVILLIIVLTFQPGFCQFKYGKIVNKEPGDRFLNDLMLHGKLDFDPLNVKKVIFKAPTMEIPYYHIIVPVKDFNGENPRFTKIKINGKDPEFYFTFVNGQMHVENWLAQKADEVKNIVLVFKYTWHNDVDYKIEVELRAPKVFNPSGPEDYIISSTVHEIKSPLKGGIPEGWKYAVMFKLAEEYGLDRFAEPVDIELAVSPGKVHDLRKEVRVMEYDPETYIFTEIPSQTYAHAGFEGRFRKSGSTHSPSLSCRVFFLADVQANKSKIFSVLYGNPDAGAPAYKTDLKVNGEVFGAVIENNYWEVKLHEKSGQLHYYRIKKTDGREVPLYSNTTSGSVHWNPDTYGGMGRWGHTFSWDPPENIYVPARGPLMFKVTRSGRMPGYNPEMMVSVTYTFIANCPYVLMSSWMEVITPYAASAIRNGEMVFDADLFDHYGWKAKNGERRFLRTLLNPDEGFDAPAMIPIDTPWLCLYNSQGKYAMGALHLNVYNYNKKDGVPATYRPKFFLYCHPQWQRPLTYFVRTLVYPFGYNHRYPPVMIPEGNVYVENGAYFPFLLGENDPYEPIEILNDKLRHPLEIYYGN
jgi:hypothetical protein